MMPSFVIDMNLSSEWVTHISVEGWPAVHWSAVGDGGAADADIMNLARTAGRIILTNDLDFGTLLALTNLDSPSVVLLRLRELLPETHGVDVIRAIRQHEASLLAGALVVVDVDRARVRVLPFHPA
jgi:predicted nuclease of predicted toxin-antitoxin system